MNNLISVIMPVYNGEKYLEDAIESILNQTFQNFEFIIINDGSKDGSLEIIQKYARLDERIIVVSRENKGLIATLNEGIDIAKGKYLARMDHDDISLNNRFTTQLTFMQTNDLDICGSSVQLFDNNNQILGQWDYPLLDQDIKYTLLCMCSFAHPSVMIKRNVFQSLKYSDYTHAEDYKLWTDIALNNFKMGNIDQVLLKYRIHANQVSQVYNNIQGSLTLNIAEEYRNHILAHSSRKFDFEYDNVDFSRMRVMLKALKLDAQKNNISKNVTLNVAQYILKHNNSLSISLYIAYFIEMKEYIKLNKHEIKIFLQALLRLNRKSKLYSFLKRYV